MKISYNWLKDYVNTDLPPEEAGVILTGLGLEVEGMEKWESVNGGLQGILIGEVMTCIKHPEADKLFVTTVDIGSGTLLNIVCGAPNVEAGQKVPVALVGARVFKGDQIIEIKNSKIRGQVSEGMICAEDELGLGSGHDGIMVLDPSAIPGTPANEYFNVVNDYVYEIGLTPNRIDSGSHFGVARDLAAFLNLNIKTGTRASLPSVENFRPDNHDNTCEVIVENRKDCPRYSGITISGVTIGESPEWLRNKLRAIGLNPINNAVDITNFVQNEIGQPLHAFDLDKIKDKKVIIRNLPDKTKFITLDEVERTLSSKDLMICDAAGGMCIAGVFGGLDTGITAATRNIFLESAYFNPISIRKTSKRHGLKTDASFRFERGTDPEITTWALKRAAMLIKEIAGGKISSDIIDIYPEKIKHSRVEVTYHNINRLTGKQIEKPVIRKILGLLDITITREDRDLLELDIPSRMVDVKQEADVIEEILRIYGYNNIEFDDHVNSTLTYIDKPDREKMVNTVADLLSSNGFAEIMCNSLNPASWYEQSEDFSSPTLVKLANPLSSDLNVMRQTLLFGGLASVLRNINHQRTDLRFYEFGNCYFRNEALSSIPVADDYSEKISLDLFISGNNARQNWNFKSSPTDFFHIKSATEMVLSRLGIMPESLIQKESIRRYFTESLAYYSGNELIAETGKISGSVLAEFNIGQDVYYSHLEWDSLMKLIRNSNISFRELPKYPSVRRDLALLLDKNIKFNEIREIALKTEKNILREVGLFDVYESDTLGTSKKSYAVSFILRDDMKTLTDKAIDKVMNNLIRAFQKELGAIIR
ncbi:MAG: phenylalanine--tRNA ligase subunit beta [Bacteroidales bacterium]|jgi:phenylalanyl-tRNA synthetase beta chain|nr:phenylalanine--tRNA ligase subunit beta [Bacteroidales bacterium]